ncbi:hypothetical protein V1522DRAFT_148565 [Lipomyces starkeyi]
MHACFRLGLTKNCQQVRRTSSDFPCPFSGRPSTDDQQAFSVVEAPSFKSFVNGIIPKYALPMRNTGTQLIVSVSAYSSLLNDMKSQSNALDSKVGLTYDVLPSRANLPYASFTVHYVDPDWQLLRNVIRTISFGLELKVLSVSDNEEAAVQGLKALKRSTRIRPLLYCAYKAASVEKEFQECSRQLTLPRDLVVLAKN